MANETGTWTTKNLGKGNWLCTLVRDGETTGIVALVGIDTHHSGAAAHFGYDASLCHRSHAIAEMARLFAQLHDTMGDVEQSGDSYEAEINMRQTSGMMPLTSTLYPEVGVVSTDEPVALAVFFGLEEKAL